MISTSGMSGVLGWLFTTFVFVSAYRYDEAYVQYNLNENKTATNPLDYASTPPLCQENL